MKYLSYVRENFGGPGFPVVEFSELRTALKPKGISDAYLKRMVNYLVGKGELKHITKGVYTFHDDITVVGFAFRPFYYGMENALTVMGLWEQGTNPIVVTPKKVKIGMRKFGSANYRIQRIRQELFFGYDLVKYYDFWIPVSDAEKTLLDLLYFRHYVRNDVLKSIVGNINAEKMDGYLARYPERFAASVSELLKTGRKAKGTY